MTDPRFPLGKFAPPASYTPERRAAFIDDIGSVPGALRAAVDGLSREQMLTPYREGGWTVAQVVHHLADSHMNAYTRIKLAVTEDTPTIKPYLEGAWANLADGMDPDISASLQFVDALHARWVTLAHSLRPADFERAMLHPERGLMTVDRSLALYAWHGRHHVAHITTLRQQQGW
jgi:uncharacterized damage-inducible protein DinB